MTKCNLIVVQESLITMVVDGGLRMNNDVTVVVNKPLQWVTRLLINQVITIKVVINIIIII